MSLQEFWTSRGCILSQPMDIECGAGTFNRHTFLRVLGPELHEQTRRVAGHKNSHSAQPSFEHYLQRLRVLADFREI